MYDVNFILPLSITKEKLSKEIRLQLQITDIDKISALNLRLDSSILNLVYDRKLLSDLYSISSSSEFKQKLIWIILIMAGLVIAYYTGVLDWLLSFLGMEPISSNTGTATTSGGTGK